MFNENTTAAIDGIFGTPSVAEVQKAFREEARLALQNVQKN